MSHVGIGIHNDTPYQSITVALHSNFSFSRKIKIHVPYYVKHVHHFKKVYVPKIHVIKHEHHHKKEYDHHHHHHEVYKSRPYKTYDKSSHGNWPFQMIEFGRAV